MGGGRKWRVEIRRRGPLLWWRQSAKRKSSLSLQGRTVWGCMVSLRRASGGTGPQLSCGGALWLGRSLLPEHTFWKQCFYWFDCFTGGAFYTPETIDTARLHYRNSWAPILHAVALWLNSTGFTCPESTEAAAVSGIQKRSPALGVNQVSGAMASAKPLPEVNQDRMHLILGECPMMPCRTATQEHL